MLLSSFAEDQYIINEHQDKVRQYGSAVPLPILAKMRWIEQFIHDSLEGSRCIGQSKWQNLELIMPKGCSECSFGPVIRFQQYLVKSRSGVQSWKSTWRHAVCQTGHQP